MSDLKNLNSYSEKTYKSVFVKIIEYMIAGFFTIVSIFFLIGGITAMLFSQRTAYFVYLFGSSKLINVIVYYLLFCISASIVVVFANPSQRFKSTKHSLTRLLVIPLVILSSGLFLIKKLLMTP